jgi:hypothetical protein
MKTWIGAKRIVFVPMIRPADANRDRSAFLERVRRRVLFDASPTGDVSFANYVHTASGGRAWIDPLVLQPVETSSEDLMYDEATRIQARDYAAANAQGVAGTDYYVAMIGQDGRAGAGGSAYAASWLFRTHAEASVGEFFMESVHTITGLMDYYLVATNLGAFDTMATSPGAHPTAYTKMLLGWLDVDDVVRHRGGHRTYSVRHQALSRPSAHAIGPAAIRVANGSGAYYVESRRVIDQFEAFINAGQTRDGVIVYQVALEDDNADPQLTAPVIYLETQSGLKSGQVFQDGGNMTVTAREDFFGGLRIEIDSPDPPSWQCGEWGRQLIQLEHSLDEALRSDPPNMDRARSLQRRIARLEARMEAAGCN